MRIIGAACCPIDAFDSSCGPRRVRTAVERCLFCTSKLMSWILCCLIICFHETTLYLGLSMVLYFIEFYKRCFSLRSYRSSTWRPIQSISLVLYNSLGISSLCSSLHCLFWNQSRYIRVDLPARLSSLNTNSRITKNKSFPLFNGSVHWALLSSFRKTVCSFSLFMLQIEQIRC